MEYEQEFEDWIEELIADGSFISHDNDTINVNWDVVEALHPGLAEDLRQIQMQEIDEAMRELCDIGLLQMGFREKEDGSLEQVFSLTEAGHRYVEMMYKE